MSVMLELYRRRFGDRVDMSEGQVAGPCPFCGDADRFSMLPARFTGAGRVCTIHRVPGTYACRACGRTGDSLKYLTRAEGVAYSEACRMLGIAGRKED